MAYLQMTVVMVYLLPHFDFELVQDAEDIKPSMTLTLAVEGGLPMRFTPRKGTHEG